MMSVLTANLAPRRQASGHLCERLSVIINPYEKSTDCGQDGVQTEDP